MESVGRRRQSGGLRAEGCGRAPCLTFQPCLHLISRRGLQATLWSDIFFFSCSEFCGSAKGNLARGFFCMLFTGDETGYSHRVFLFFFFLVIVAVVLEVILLVRPWFGGKAAPELFSRVSLPCLFKYSPVSRVRKELIRPFIKITWCFFSFPWWNKVDAVLVCALNLNIQPAGAELSLA